jgi:hypothetical protein
VGATWLRLVAGGLTIYVVLTALAIGLGP